MRERGTWCTGTARPALATASAPIPIGTRCSPGSMRRCGLRWAQATAAAWGMAGAEVGLVVSELVTNALRFTRSGQPGGTVVVAVAGGWDSVTVHVHDLGADGGQVPRPRQAGADADGGRGL